MHRMLREICVTPVHVPSCILFKDYSDVPIFSTRRKNMDQQDPSELIEDDELDQTRQRINQFLNNDINQFDREKCYENFQW